MFITKGLSAPHTRTHHHLKKLTLPLLDQQKNKQHPKEFLVDGSGNVVGRYAPTTPPSQIVADIEKLL